MTATASPSQRTKPPRTKRFRRIVGSILGGGFLLWLAAQFVAPPVNQAGLAASQRLVAYVVGEDRPIELAPLCIKQGGIVRPQAEKDAAFQWRCERSRHLITRQQIAQQCADQWGPELELVLRDRDSAAGWKCHKRGWIR